MGAARASVYICRASRISRRPCAKRRPVASSPSPALPWRRSGLRPPSVPAAASDMAQVLIIDDHDSMRDGLELLLRKRGHRTRSAEGGQRGLDLLEEEGADLVI